jgi:hypothetical protein
MAQIYERFGTTSSTGYSGSLLDWGEERLRNTESFVYSRLADPQRLENAQRAALPLYHHDPLNVRWPAANYLNEAFCLSRIGDTAGGTAHARAVIDRLPFSQRSHDVRVRAVEVLSAIPQAEQNRPVVAEYREWLNSAFSDTAGGRTEITSA